MNDHIPTVATGFGIPRRRSTILVVEDNDDQWFITNRILRHTLPDTDAVRTSDASETLSYLMTCSPNHRPLPALILLDLYLPDRKDGWALLEALKLHHTFRRLPVVILSSSDNPEDIEQSYYLRSSSYLMKQPLTRNGKPTPTILGIIG